MFLIWFFVPKYFTILTLIWNNIYDFEQRIQQRNEKELEGFMELFRFLDEFALHQWSYIVTESIYDILESSVIVMKWNCKFYIKKNRQWFDGIQEIVFLLTSICLIGHVKSSFFGFSLSLMFLVIDG